MRGRAPALPLLAGLLAATPAHALFHIAVIDELMSGVNGDPRLQYVEIRMLASSQNYVCHTRLTVFRCQADGGGAQVLIGDLGGGGATNPCLANSGSTVRWIMASPGGAAFLSASGITPDFTWDASASGGIPTSCGMVCWGAPGLLPPNPPTWDATVPGNYVDCVAYGPYDGTAEPLGHAAASATPGDGTLSLTKVGADMFTNDFQLACPTPENDAGAMGSFGPCSATTTTTSPGATTTSPGGATTTTVPTSGKSKCASKELLAAARTVAAEMRCEAKAVAKGEPAKLPACIAKARAAFAGAYKKAVGAGGCRTPVTAASVEGAVDAFVEDLATTLTGGATTASKCPSRVLAATGAKASAALRCHAKAVGKGNRAKLASCVASAAARFTKAYAKATAAGGCLEPADATTVEGRVDAFVAALRAAIAP